MIKRTDPCTTLIAVTFKATKLRMKSRKQRIL